MTTLTERMARLSEERRRRVEERADTLIAEEIQGLSKAEREAKARVRVRRRL